MTMRRFIVTVDESTAKEHRDAITAIFKDQLAYWHWIGNVWIVVDPKQKWSAQTLRDEINLRADRKIPQLVVIQIEGDETPSWFAFGKKERFKWFHSNWSKSKPAE